MPAAIVTIKTEAKLGTNKSIDVITSWLDENIGTKGEDWDCMNGGKSLTDVRSVMFILKEEEDAVAFKLMFS